MTGGVCSIRYSFTIIGGGGGGKKSMLMVLSGELSALELFNAERLVWGGGELGGDGENTDERAGDMEGGGGGPSDRALGGVVGVSGGYSPLLPSLPSPSANCRKAAPTPLRETTNCACEAAKWWRDVTVCFIRRFLCLHRATPSSLSTLELEHPIARTQHRETQ